MSFSLYASFMSVFPSLMPEEYKKSVQYTGSKKGELVEGWNPMTKKWEYNSQEEWDNIDKRKDVQKPTENTSTDMKKLKGMDLSNLEVPEFDEEGAPTGKTKTVDKGDFKINLNVGPTKGPVHVQNRRTSEKTGKEFGEGLPEGEGLEDVALVMERSALQQLRGKMSETVNKRFDKNDQSYSETVEQGVVNHCQMAENLTKLLEPSNGFDPNVLFTGLLSRIKGDVEGQGGFENPTAEDVKNKISASAGRLKEGKGDPNDANMITQFIAAFVDGLTEVIECNQGDVSKQASKDQFDTIWPSFRDSFGLTDNDKDKLLERVEGYKKLAGGLSDTLSGKSGRKAQTRAGRMPNDPAYKIEDEDALIKGDISGSMHSQLLAQELSTTLLGGKGPKIKDPGESVQVTDTGLLNARALDALLLTAGGKNEHGDNVFHTAYEMINGMQKITGCPKVSQEQATNIMVILRKGKSFTEAMEEVFPFPKDGRLPWRDGN